MGRGGWYSTDDARVDFDYFVGASQGYRMFCGLSEQQAGATMPPFLLTEDRAVLAVVSGTFAGTQVRVRNRFTLCEKLVRPFAGHTLRSLVALEREPLLPDRGAVASADPDAADQPLQLDSDKNQTSDVGTLVVLDQTGKAQKQIYAAATEDLEGMIVAASPLEELLIRVGSSNSLITYSPVSGLPQLLLSSSQVETAALRQQLHIFDRGGDVCDLTQIIDFRIHARRDAKCDEACAKCRLREDLGVFTDDRSNRPPPPRLNDVDDSCINREFGFFDPVKTDLKINVTKTNLNNIQKANKLLLITDAGGNTRSIDLQGRDLDYLILAVWAEASRGVGATFDRERRAVASVIFNRLRQPGFPTTNNTLRDVVAARDQFQVATGPLVNSRQFRMAFQLCKLAATGYSTVWVAPGREFTIGNPLDGPSGSSWFAQLKRAKDAVQHILQDGPITNAQSFRAKNAPACQTGGTVIGGTWFSIVEFSPLSCTEPEFFDQ